MGRYWNVGPQKTLYIPWPLLNTGNNHMYLFETEKGFKTIRFTDKPKSLGIVKWAIKSFY